MKGNLVIALALVVACGSCEEADVRVPEPEIPEEPAPEPARDVRTPGDELCESSLGSGWCVPAGQGAWRLEDDSSPVDCGLGNIPEEGRRGRMRINFVTTDSRAEGGWEEFDDCDSTVEFDGFAHFDWDGDGFDELAVRRGESYLDGGESSAWILRFSNGTISRFTALPEEAGEVFEVRDEDWDGRLDIVTRGPHQHGPFSTDCCANVYSGGPSTLWHSLPDGSFTRSDEIALTHLREMCGDTQRPLFGSVLDEIAECVEEDWGSVQTAVTCARLGGDGAERIRERAQAELDAFECRAEQCCSQLDSLADDVARLAENVNTDVTLN